MAEHGGLLQAVLDAPEDDTPRLVYADWLEENDEPARAEFIRVQVEAASLPGTELARYRALHKRAGLLLRDHEREFLGPLQKCGYAAHPYGGREGTMFGFRRGFVESVSVYGREAADRFPAHAGVVFASAPVRTLTFAADVSSIDDGMTPWNYEPLDAVILAAVLRLPSLSRLRQLGFTGQHFGEEEVRLLTACPHLPPGLTLQLHGNDLTTAAQVLLRQHFGRRAEF
jgi:uncharacterized protein (TIGR02996 family)